MAATTERAPSTVTIVRIVVTVAATLLVLYGSYLVRHVLVLVIIAAFFAVGLDPAVRKLESLGLGRGLAIASIFVAALAAVAGFLAAVIPPLVDQVTSFATDLPGYVEDVGRRHPRIEQFIEDNDIAQRLRDATQKAPDFIAGSFGSVVGVVGSVFSTLFNGLTLIVLTIYFLLSLSRIRKGSLRLVPRSKRRRVGELLDPILEKIGGYIAGQTTVALIAGAISFTFLTIAGVGFPIALALWVAIAALIPMVGATLGAIPAVVVAFFDSPGLGVATLAFFIVYQQLENYLIAPRIMKRAVDVSPAAVLLAALIGGSLLGFVGALMAIPTAAAIKLLAEEVVLPTVDRG